MLTSTNTSVDGCDWYGVDCDTGRVTALALDGDGVQVTSQMIWVSRRP
jgi:hypothetical protein